MSQGGFLPPQAAGREPDLGGAPDPPPPAPAPGGFAAPSGAAPPAPPQRGQAPHPSWYQPQPGWASGPAEPDNGPAVLGFALSLSSIGLLVISAGLSSLVSIGLGIVGMLQGAKGKRLVRDGHTAKNKDLAQAGFVIGIVATVLAGLATLFWIAIAIAIAVDEDARREFERELDDQRGDPAVLTAAVTALRMIGLFLS